jgi:hypothetical protein
MRSSALSGRPHSSDRGSERESLRTSSPHGSITLSIRKFCIFASQFQPLLSLGLADKACSCRLLEFLKQSLQFQQLELGLHTALSLMRTHSEYAANTRIQIRSVIFVGEHLCGSCSVHFFDALVQITLFSSSGSLIKVYSGLPDASWSFLAAPRGWLGASVCPCVPLCGLAASTRWTGHADDPRPRPPLAAVWVLAQSPQGSPG